ncbi:heavy metal-associated isoprenylated plant protein 34 [Sorghum bicolor]|uniref:Senescence regulator n=1 Tax=Sorghum bicolor TaxID=4558 RepID=A0A1B6PM40_SORBI|nr:heavy metal-associated isoprenylated plant protein 34 [Sorghum bicolor]KXG26730.1 hypothetical protein SORBI_3006G149700 [Sorghum bicolor]|eukprot:XP_002448198.2 heavy metal-associated isoprenylated plant protein 34 [Sorghum bicolor]
MAGSARSSAAAKHAYRMFAPSRGGGAATRGPGAGAAEEFDESDVVWGSFGGGGGADSHSSPGAELQAAAGWARPIPASRAGAGRKKPAAVDGGGAAGSLPMNIPDWQKILGVEYRDHYRAGEWEPDADDDDHGRARGGGGAGAEMVPPHELAWRSRAASMSVHEGIGRTLKGRDLSRVRDAVWKKTGFEAD